MTRFFSRFLIPALILSGFAAPAFADTETFQLDPGHTYVLWRISHFGFSYPAGKWMANGTIKIGEIDTGNPKLNEHLLSKAFFDVAQFPTATFVSDKVNLTGKDTAKVTGVLTLHGVSKPVTLNVKLNKIGTNPITEKKAIGFSATTELKRSDFGMETLLPALGNEIKLNIEAEGELA
jgi:polyisoprenoid-binding protein YceI